MVERHAFAPIPTKRWVDLRATCCSFALPRSLDKALTALGLPVKKDKEGQRFVRSLSRPNRKTGAYPELTTAIIERVVEYNRIDILALEAMREQGLARLTASEQAVWELDQRINARGIAIDTGFVQAAKRIADQVMGEAITEFARLTNGVSPHQVQKIREWLRCRRWALPNLESETVSEALELAGLPNDVRRVLEIRQIAAAASLKKLDAMLACVGPDGRARGLLQYHGATTGRWSGQLIQPQNFPRPTLEADVDPEDLVAAVKTGDPDALRGWGNPVEVLISGLRCALTAAEGKVFGAGDFSMIEACVLLALAGQHDKCKLITEGADVYRDMAATIYGFDRNAFMAIPEEDLSPDETEQRRTGKNGVLSCGYGIGAEGFYRRFCRHVEGGKELAAKIVAVYRNTWRRLCRTCGGISNRLRVGQCFAPTRPPSRIAASNIGSRRRPDCLASSASSSTASRSPTPTPALTAATSGAGPAGSITPTAWDNGARSRPMAGNDRERGLGSRPRAAGRPHVRPRGRGLPDRLYRARRDCCRALRRRQGNHRADYVGAAAVGRAARRPVKAKAWVGKRYAKGAAPTPQFISAP